MKVGLIHIDGKLPNLALMKLSAWHKAKSDEVVLYRSADDYLNGDLFNQCDKAYGAVVFTDNKHKAEQLADTGVIVGGAVGV